MQSATRGTRSLTEVGGTEPGRGERFLETLMESMRGTPQTRLVLLGAGASAEAGLPTGEVLDAVLRSEASLTLYTQLSEALADHLGYADVERAFRMLEHLSDALRPETLAWDLDRSGLFQLRPTPSIHKQARVELSRIVDRLRRQLWIPDGLGSPLARVAAEAAGKQFEVNERVRYLRPLVLGQQGGTIVSLNYDNCIEEAAAGDPHVRVSNPAYKRVIAPVKDDPNYTRLLKLHGSLSWRRVGDDVVAGARPLDPEQYEPAIVFGAGTKLRHYGPFLDLLRGFKDRLETTTHIVTIGYSFRDPHVNDALRTWAHDPPKKRLIVCMGPNTVALPIAVEPWLTLEHLQVQLLSQTASECIGTLWPEGA